MSAPDPQVMWVEAWRLAQVHESVARLRLEATRLRAKGDVHSLIDAEKDEAAANARELTLQQLGLPLEGLL